MHKSRLLLPLSIILLGLTPHVADPMDRAEIDDRYKWNLTDIYTGWDNWEKDLKSLETLVGRYAELKGTIGRGPQQLVKVFKLEDAFGMLADRVYGYASLSRDLDTRENETYARLQQVQIVQSRAATESSWINPELLQIPWENMKQWLADTPDLAPYRFRIENLYRQQQHVLDSEQERLLSYFQRWRENPRTVRTQLATADIEFETITLSTGEEVKVTEGSYSRIISTNRNQEDRKAAMEARNGVYNKAANTYAAAYDGICQRDWAFARARNYSSCLEAALDQDNVPVDVYLNLIEAVRKGTGPLQRFHKLRARALKLDEYHLYDSGIPVVEIDEDYAFEDVKKDVLNSMKPLGSEYQEHLNQAFTPGWIDVYETPGKATGAYSSSVYGVHPYMLLNYNDTLRYFFTVAHEMGHTVHSMFSHEAQPFATSDYTIFVAEVASTMAEAYLLDYLLEKSDDPKERLVLLSQAINDIDGTFYTQVMFADFEYRAHKLAEEGQPITAEVLSGIYRQLLADYYGEGVAHDDLYDITWTRIPHFFRPYYVYKYATCYASSASLFRRMHQGSKAEQKAAVEDYLVLLKSGGSDYPMEQLKTAGVDLSRPDAVNAVIQRMNDLVVQFEAELRNLDLID